MARLRKYGTIPRSGKKKPLPARAEKITKAVFVTKNHISINVNHKFIRVYSVTSANAHDSKVFEELLDPNNSSKDVWTDSAYRSHKKIETLKAIGYRKHLQRKGSRNHKLTRSEQQGNRTRSRIRYKVEKTINSP